MFSTVVNVDKNFGYHPWYGSYPYDTFRESRVWYHSPRERGKLKLRAQEFSLERLATQKHLLRSPSYDAPPPVAIEAAALKNNLSDWRLENALNQAKSESYARFRGKLYKGSAALGVTLGSYNQSKDMIIRRYNQLNKKADQVLASFPQGVIQMTPRRVASLHLEVIFGWVPLLVDVHSAATIAAHAFPPQFVTARARKSGYVARSTLYPHAPTEFYWSFRSTRSAKVTVINPNLWIGERLGLLNPATVAWDLVPWSFVVNMFVNTSQLVSSFTDFAGLQFSDSSHTVNQSLLGYAKQVERGAICTSKMSVKRKYRSLDAIERPPLAFKLPGVDASLVTMTASLFTQKFGKIFGLK